MQVVAESAVFVENDPAYQIRPGDQSSLKDSFTGNKRNKLFGKFESCRIDDDSTGDSRGFRGEGGRSDQEH